MISKAKVTEIVNEWLAEKEYFLVDVSVSADNCVSVEIDHADGVWIEDCVLLSRHIEANLDRDVEDYELEVGSAGIGQPFKVLRQYINHIGKEVEVLAKDGKKYRGIMARADEAEFAVTIQVKEKPEGAKRPVLVDKEYAWRYEDVKYTKYLIKF
ncbi:MAG: ribosome assembly cofactor RimP [Bacteroidaceae bacterium]|nr:ribosome assembly cofactor RimP [Bacteroidaceae bacterium]MBQ3239060.1 ribosome assembly cofactor RimP [Bacteroidaceae bacterium]MBR3983665.1 ribosome assembly cofactor RimP [Bacteroidaceae bacterium]